MASYETSSKKQFNQNTEMFWQGCPNISLGEAVASGKRIPREANSLTPVLSLYMAGRWFVPPCSTDFPVIPPTGEEPP